MARPIRITKPLMRKVKNLATSGWFDADDCQFGPFPLRQRDLLAKHGIIRRAERMGMRRAGQGDWTVTRNGKMLCGLMPIGMAHD